MIEIGLGHYLSLGAIIFFLGVIGIFLKIKVVLIKSMKIFNVSYMIVIQIFAT